MKTTPLDKDLRQLSYEDFKAFMQGLAALYSDVNSHYNFMGLFKDLSNVGKKVEMLPLDFSKFYGAYEIADQQIVLAVFNINLDFPEDDNEAAHIESINVSFAEDTPYLRCPVRIRELLTQPDYVAKADQAYPRLMEEILQEKWKARFKATPKSNSNQPKFTPQCNENRDENNDDIPF